MSDFIPRTDADYDTFSENFNDKIAAAPASYGLTAADATDLTLSYEAWADAYPEHTAAQVEAATKAAAKDTARANLTAKIRSIAGRIQASPAIPDAMRESLNLPVYDTVRTPAITEIESWPVGAVNTATRLRHRLDFRDSVSNRKAKPAGVLCCEVWMFVGDELPADDSAFLFTASETKTPYRNDFTAAQARKTAFYKLRWKLKSGGYGPWSPVVSATIPG